MMTWKAFWIVLVFLSSLLAIVQSFILCHCDTPECRASRQKECLADFYCYVSFRPAEATEQETSATSLLMHGAGSQLFKAEHRGCVNADHQFDLCNSHRGGVAGFNEVSAVDKASGSGGGGGGGGLGESSHRSAVRCCVDSWCNDDKKFVFTRAELTGRQFSLYHKLSDLEPDLEESMSSKKKKKTTYHTSLVEHLIGKQGKLSGTFSPSIHSPYPQNPLISTRKRPAYTRDVPLKMGFVQSQPGSSSSLTESGRRGFAGSMVVSNPGHGNHQVSASPNTEVENLTRHPEIAFQPVYIVVCVCLLILLLVAVLLHIVVVLHRRHRRLKAELRKQGQMPIGGELSYWPITDRAGSTQVGPQINLLPLNYPMLPTHEVCSITALKPNGRLNCLSNLCGLLTSNARTKDVCNDEVSQQVKVLSPNVRFTQSMNYEPRASAQTPVNYPSIQTTTTSTSIHSPIPTPITIQSQLQLQQQQQQQHIIYSSHSAEYGFYQIPAKSTCETESSASGGSQNNPSTAESSLPTQPSTVSGWTPNSCLHQNGNAHLPPHTKPQRPSLSGSSASSFPDFESRRANVALPPALFDEAFSPAATTTGLTLFRSSSSSHNETSSMVIPYAQLRLSLAFDQYDTPEQIFADPAGDSVSGLSSPYAYSPQNKAGSNPTTDSSLLHSYCEKVGGQGFPRTHD